MTFWNTIRSRSPVVGFRGHSGLLMKGAPRFRVPRSEFRVAFTLVELMTVVAIIALLLSLLMPAVRRAREVAYVAACASNEHQVTLAAISYANDNYGAVPLGYVSKGQRSGNYYLAHNGGPVCMFGLLYTSQELTNARAFYCPAATMGGIASASYYQKDFGPSGNLSWTAVDGDNAVRCTTALRPSVYWHDTGSASWTIEYQEGVDEFKSIPRVQQLGRRAIFSCAYPRYAPYGLLHFGNSANVAFMDGSISVVGPTARHPNLNLTLAQTVAAILSSGGGTGATDSVRQLFEIFDQQPALTP